MELNKEKIARENILRESKEAEGLTVKGYDFNEGINYDKIIDSFATSGAQATNLAKTGARLVVVGVHKSPVQFDLVNLLMRELSIIGSMAYTEEFPEVIAMLESAKVDPKPIISHRFKLSDFHEALATAQDTGNAIKVLIDCQN